MSRAAQQSGRQRQRHGVAKNLAEGIGGLVVGAALVVLIRGMLKQRAASAPSAMPANAPSNQPEEQS
jgi:hypothetical protein